MADAPPNRFAKEFQRWVDLSGQSYTSLGRAMGYTRSYVSKVANGGERGSRKFVGVADEVMSAGGSLVQAWTDHHRPRPHHDAIPVAEPGDDTGGLVVDHDHAELRYQGGTYRLTQRRRLTNNGTAPVTRYLIRISVDRYPGEPERSNAHYRENPLTWHKIGLRAWVGEHRDHALTWTVQHDRDSFKEVWLKLESQDGQRFPLYPGASCWIEYTYTVDDTQWGNWFRRAVRLPTRHLSVTVDFPSDVDPAVWGVHTSLTGADMPLSTPINHQSRNDRELFSWATQDPPMHARFTLEWHYRNAPTRHSDDNPAAVMADLGIVQDGDDLLRRTAQTFDLTTETDNARRIIDELQHAVDRVARAHTFNKGMGIAAPQIGIDRAAAITYPPGDPNPIVLINPRIIESSAETDTQYEGCLSFFDVRCRIPRPLTIHVEHYDLDGARRITIFDKGLARLVAHEVDHLYGTLCRDHLPDDEPPTPIAQYRGTGDAWQYPAKHTSP